MNKLGSADTANVISPEIGSETCHIEQLVCSAMQLLVTAVVKK